MTIIGAGSIGERHLRCLLSTGRADVSFVETAEVRRAEIAHRYPSAVAHADLNAAIAACCDAAVIATPAPTHVPLAQQLTASGIHVLIEKPLAVALDGAAELADTVRRCGVVAAVAYVYRAHPAMADMRTAIASGQIGRPLQVVAVGGQHFPTYRPTYRQTYYASHASGGGAVQDALTHVLNAAEWLVGPIDRVAADTACLVLEGVDVEDTVHVLARHRDLLGSYAYNQHQTPNELTITVVGDAGTARFEHQACRWCLMSRPGEAWKDFNFGPLDRDAMFVRQANHFLDTIEGKTRAACTLEEGIATLRVNLAVLASARNRTWQVVSPE
ncbi:MAG: Gfo/Idh/MocA family oxidoreductase [Tepidisphaeraceae bacterium]